MRVFLWEYSDYTDKIWSQSENIHKIYLHLKYLEAYWYNELWLFKYFSDHREIYNYLY